MKVSKTENAELRVHDDSIIVAVANKKDIRILVSPSPGPGRYQIGADGFGADIIIDDDYTEIENCYEYDRSVGICQPGYRLIALTEI